MAKPIGMPHAGGTGGDDGSDEFVFVPVYRHRSGKLMVARKYGYQAWRLRIRKSKKNKK